MWIELVIHNEYNDGDVTKLAINTDNIVYYHKFWDGGIKIEFVGGENIRFVDSYDDVKNILGLSTV